MAPSSHVGCSRTPGLKTTSPPLFIFQRPSRHVSAQSGRKGQPCVAGYGFGSSPIGACTSMTRIAHCISLVCLPHVLCQAEPPLTLAPAARRRCEAQKTYTIDSFRPSALLVGEQVPSEINRRSIGSINVHVPALARPSVTSPQYYCAPRPPRLGGYANRGSRRPPLHGLVDVVYITVQKATLLYGEGAYDGLLYSNTTTRRQLPSI